MPADYMKFVNTMIVNKAVHARYGMILDEIYFPDSFNDKVPVYDFIIPDESFYVRIYLNREGPYNYYACAVLTEKYKLLKKMEA